MIWTHTSFDIHCGGVDLIFPHHTNEIAQSEAATGKKFVNYWLHNAHLMVNGKRMAKSLGNFYTLRDIIKKGINPLLLRLILIKIHYRQVLNFKWTDFKEAENIVKKIINFLINLDFVPTRKNDFITDKELIMIIENCREKFK
jgi:cysteinyl-tRNA synthetase